MKIEELMIGDWVNVFDVPKQIEGIRTFNKNGYKMVYYDGDNGNYITSVTPIPLTEEILHNNGFKNDVIAQKSIIAEGASNFSVILISEDNRIAINNIDEFLNSFNKWYIHIDTEDMRTLCVAEITYVHELQHVLNLCKIEKEIII